MEKLVQINEAVEALKEGKTLLYPTDTVWGLGCDATNEEAINRLNKVKNRPEDKSFILLVESVPMLERYVRTIPDVCYDLIDLSEKPLTIIYDSPMNLPDSIIAKDGTIGIRVTKDMNCRKMIQRLRAPLISTSANLSGSKTPVFFKDIDKEIIDRVDFILNDRLEEKMSQPSSIIKIDQNFRVKVIR